MDKVSCSTEGGICMVSSFSREMEKGSQRTGESSSVLLVCQSWVSPLTLFSCHQSSCVETFLTGHIRSLRSWRWTVLWKWMLSCA